ncbi:Short-chain dehydrogenase/reductase (SDR) family protein [Modestobacter italicus]|uniref:Short-chain dehydrogenase/reductase (SDR) family protein n=1 Tax=Modestobacter italicus (strain DSM 44449 / CECT 9708 / BC 501) TaxID=2732864 RepID=I4F0B0_MODI5|nr:SDR family NAD(P)-dependent oxidoreductase [Modestobacter marinus]CCH89073.1 Short-chain dehydrogenase/reductase (SDR) family protein [Modestobacter marinus]
MSTHEDPVRDRTVLVTGAGRGIGAALVEELLRRGARRVHAGTRGRLVHPDPRVSALRLDVTDHAEVRAAARALDTLDVLVNNAGVSLPGELGDEELLARHLAVNLLGPLAVTEAFLPQLTRSRGRVVNVLSVAALASVPVLPAYSISKAAAFSLTQSQRTLLALRGITVHAVLAGPVDTDMTRDLDVPKATAASVARALLDGVAAGEEEVFPDPFSRSLAPGWADGPVKQLERANAAMLGARR